MSISKHVKGWAKELKDMRSPKAKAMTKARSKFKAEDKKDEKKWKDMSENGDRTANDYR